MPTDFPAMQAVKLLDAKHDDWTRLYSYWEKLRKLGEGGITMEQSADAFLIRRPMEREDVYGDRIARMGYADHLGNITGWYVSALFKQPPTVILRAQDAATGDERVVDKGEEQNQKLSQFQDNCDGGGRSLVAFWQQSVEPQLLLYRKAYILFDLPPAPAFMSRAQQQASGALRPHLVAYTPQDVINWQVDEQGNLVWVVLKLAAKTQDSPFDPIRQAHRWYIFTRDQVIAYEYVLKTEVTQNIAPTDPRNPQPLASPYPDNAQAKLLPGYPKPHSLADQNKVPVFVQEIHHDHWIGNRLASPLCKLLNLENSYDWALEQTNLAMVVLETTLDIDQIRRSEVGFLKLNPGDKAYFLEQSGKAFEASQKRINEIREEVYRLAYLVAQGRSSSASATVQSGYSKEQDMLPARDILSGLGDQARDAFQTLLQAAADRMELGLSVDVQGFDFSDRSDVIELEVIQKADSVSSINSPTYERERDKRLVNIALPDLSRETKQKIYGEIDESPTENMQQEAQMQQLTSKRMQEVTRLASPKLFEDAAAAA